MGLEFAVYITKTGFECNVNENHACFFSGRSNLCNLDSVPEVSSASDG